MRNRLLGLVISTSMLAAGAAFAADAGPTMPGSATPAAATSSTTSTTTTTTEKSGAVKMSHAGVIKSFDAQTHMLKLQDGSSFVLDQSLKGDDLKANDKITFNYKTDGQAKTVTDYKVVPQS